MKRWVSFDFDANTNKSLSLVKPKTEPKQAKIMKKFDFEQKVVPINSIDLAVNKNKIDLVREWLKNFVIKSNNQTIAPILVITGPTGSGKTVTLTILCKELDIEVLEWINPLSINYEYESGPGQTTKFLEFIQESKYPSLITNNEKKVVLVEDYPNTFLKDNKEFHEVLENIVHCTTKPIVFICTDTNHIKTSLYHKLFPEDVQLKYEISTINFITASVTLLKNALKRVQNIIKDGQNFTVPSSTVLEAIANSAMGDIRCAINNYHLAALNDTNAIQTFEKKSKKRKRHSLTTVAILRDDNLGIFHLLGRILNPKRKDHNNSWRLDCNLEDTVDEFMTYPTTGLNFLKHNYLKYFDDFDEACKASDVFSQTQLFMQSILEQYDLQKLGLWYCTLGIMIANKHKVSKWNQIKAPKRDEHCLNNDTEGIDPTDGYYYDLINKTSKFYKFL